MRSRLRSVHRSAKAVVFFTKRLDCAGVTGIAYAPQNLSCARSLAKHEMWVLSPMPRGSQLTTSKRPRPKRLSLGPMRLTVATPGTPGPPKFTNNDPIRCAGRLAGRRITDSEIVRPSGCDQFSGTATRAHCSPRGPSPQGFHAIGAAAAVAAQSNSTAPIASRARTARRHEGASGASADMRRHYGSPHHIANASRKLARDHVRRATPASGRQPASLRAYAPLPACSAGQISPLAVKSVRTSP